MTQNNDPAKTNSDKLRELQELFLGDLDLGVIAPKQSGSEERPA